jgi:hypothetical protein
MKASDLTEKETVGTVASKEADLPLQYCVQLKFSVHWRLSQQVYCNAHYTIHQIIAFVATMCCITEMF